MPSGSYKGKADVLCPFYKFDDWNKHRIVCEGIVDQATLASTFRFRHDYQEQLDIFCCKHYKMCEIYRMIYDAKYDDE